jgi:hypothetical protein
MKLIILQRERGERIMKERIESMFQSRKARQEDPAGTFDKGGRWYPSETERCDCCDRVRSPSRAYPYSYLLHCRTRTHITTLLSK